MNHVRISYILTGFAEDEDLVTEIEIPAELDPRGTCGMPDDDEALKGWYPTPQALVEATLEHSRKRGFVPPMPVARWEVSVQKLYRLGWPKGSVRPSAEPDDGAEAPKGP